MSKPFSALAPFLNVIDTERDKMDRKITQRKHLMTEQEKGTERERETKRGRDGVRGKVIGRDRERQ